MKWGDLCKLWVRNPPKTLNQLDESHGVGLKQLPHSPEIEKFNSLVESVESTDYVVYSGDGIVKSVTLNEDGDTIQVRTHQSHQTISLKHWDRYLDVIPTEFVNRYNECALEIRGLMQQLSPNWLFIENTQYMQRNNDLYELIFKYGSMLAYAPYKMLPVILHNHGIAPNDFLDDLKCRCIVQRKIAEYKSSYRTRVVYSVDTVLYPINPIEVGYNRNLDNLLDFNNPVTVIHQYSEAEIFQRVPVNGEVIEWLDLVVRYPNGTIGAINGGDYLPNIPPSWMLTV